VIKLSSGGASIGTAVFFALKSRSTLRIFYFQKMLKSSLLIFTPRKRGDFLCSLHKFFALLYELFGTISYLLFRYDAV
jgi:hypothetical protein